jgi:hypothetical protein
MDPNDTDYATSGYETGSTSLSSTVNEYVFENGTYLNDRLKQPQSHADFVGRRYHAYYGTDKNLLPTDEVHMNGLLKCYPLTITAIDRARPDGSRPRDSAPVAWRRAAQSIYSEKPPAHPRCGNWDWYLGNRYGG